MSNNAAKKFTDAKNKMLELGSLLSCVDILRPGFIQRVTRLFLESQIESLLPRRIVKHPDFELLYSGRPYCFGTSPRQMLKYDLIRCKIILPSGLLRECRRVSSDVNTNSCVKKAITTYVHYWGQDYKKAFLAARYALMDSWVDHFDCKVDCLALTFNFDEDILILAKAIEEVNRRTDIAIDYVEWEMNEEAKEASMQAVSHYTSSVIRT